MFVVYRRMSVRKALQYVAAQLLGAFLATLIVYATYSETIKVFEDGARSVPGTAGMFVPFPAEWMSIGSLLWSEVSVEHLIILYRFPDASLQILGTAILAIIISAATDKANKMPGYLAPIMIFVAAVGLFGSYGMHGEELNPARTIMPRLVMAIFYGGEGKFTPLCTTSISLPCSMIVLAYRGAAWVYTALVSNMMFLRRSRTGVD